MAADDKVLLKTMTGENFMLARIHFIIRDKNKVLQTLARLKCTDFDRAQGRWTWLYGSEAKGLKFELPFESIPVERRPIILGSIFLTNDAEGYLNTNSFERATKFLTFFDQKIGRAAMEFTDIEIVNKLITSTEMAPNIYQKYFDLTPPRSNRADVAWERMQMIADAPISQDRKRDLLQKRALDDAKKPLDLIERLPCNFYDPEGIRTLEAALKMREVIAMQHWRGNTDFNFHNLIEPMIKQLSSGLNAPVI